MAKSNILLFPSWGKSAGQLTSILEFTKRLLSVSADDISVTVLLTNPPSVPHSPTSLTYIKSIETSQPNIHFHHLPELHLPQNLTGPIDSMSTYAQLYQHELDAFLSSSSTPVAAIVFDMFTTALFDVAHKHAVPAYVYFSTNALMLGLTLHLHRIDIPGEFGDYEGDVVVPDTVAVPARSMPAVWMNRKGKCYEWFVYHGKRFREAKGIVINTVEEVESGVLSAVRDGRFVDGGTMPEVYPVGPVSIGGGNEKKGECVEWLEKQPHSSVVFLCFGTMGAFSPDQVKEIAEALERSGHRFLWSIRVAGPGMQLLDANIDEILPEGFVERTKERGLVWPTWAPQAEILAHPSVGGFVTHCGWNSVMESLWFGVPMLAWPLYAEQHLNEVEMVRDLGIAVGMKVDRKRGNFVAAEELERAVRSLMGESVEGERVCAKVAEMKTVMRKAVQEGGSSYLNLKKLALDLGASA